MCVNPIYYNDMWVPCRRCFECRFTRAREWSVRCYFELSKYVDNCFITLTYDPVHNPITLQKRDLQLFFKRLRKHFPGRKIRYFACGEYGPNTYRPHYHIVIFGLDFSDKKLFSKSNKGYPIYISDTLSALWVNGIHTIQTATQSTVIYSALYSAKATKALPKHLQEAPEFNLMSQKIGTDVISSKMETYIKTDEIWIDGKSYRIPNSVLMHMYVVTDDKGCVVAKATEYEDIKSRRLEKYNANNPELVKIREKLIKQQKSGDLFGYTVSDVDFEAVYRNIIADNDMRARNRVKGLHKSI